MQMIDQMLFPSTGITMSAIPSPISPGPRVGGRGGSRSLDLLERRADQLLFGLRALGSPELLRSPPSRSPAVQVSIMLPAFPVKSYTSQTKTCHTLVDCNRLGVLLHAQHRPEEPHAVRSLQARL